MPDMPSLGHPARSRPLAVALAAALLAVALLGGFLVKARQAAAERRVAAAAAAAAVASRAAAAEAAAMAAAASAPPPPATPSAAASFDQPGVHHLSLSMNGPLERGIVSLAGRAVGLPLTQVTVRALVWWLSVPGDLHKGDTLDVLFEQRPGDEPLVQAIRYRSGKMGRLFRAYRFQPATARFARCYQPDGSELEARLEDGPLDDYEQVTSLLRDGRGHRGVDFKTPVGTPVKATFDGVITRRTWNFRMNGNSLEVREEGGPRTAVFLHLAELPAAARVGAHVRRGQVVAHSGNTGHSFAPHLHYQLSTSRQPVLDPFSSHGTSRRALPEADRAAFEAEVRRLDALLDGQKAGT